MYAVSRRWTLHDSQRCFVLGHCRQISSLLVPILKPRTENLVDPCQVSRAHQVQGQVHQSLHLWRRHWSEGNSQRKEVVASLADTQKNLPEAAIYPLFLFLKLLSLNNQKMKENLVPSGV